jgi:hypothetical protein
MPAWQSLESLVVVLGFVCREDIPLCGVRHSTVKSSYHFEARNLEPQLNQLNQCMLYRME